MLVKEKKITKAMIQLDDNEMACLNDVSSIAKYFIDLLGDNKARKLVSSSTGEIIDIEDFFRLRGILSGLIDCEEWILKQGLTKPLLHAIIKKKQEMMKMTERELREIKERLDYLYSRVDEVKEEMKEITDEIFSLELYILLRG